MKKTISILAIVILLAGGLFILTGCGEKEVPTVTETYEYTARNVRVSASYPEESGYRKSEDEADIKNGTSTVDMAIVGEKVRIQFDFGNYLMVDKSFNGLKEWYKNSFKSSYKDITVNGREANYREVGVTDKENVYLAINIEDVSDTKIASNMLVLQVIVSAVNEEDSGKALFETEEVQKIIQSIKVEQIDPSKPIKE